MQPRISPHRRKYRPSKRQLPYERHVVLLSRGELAFYRALRRATAFRFLIAVKVRAADLLSCPADSWEQGFGHMVARHHLDFVLCDPSTTAILAAIELDDRSHTLAPRKRRDTFLNDAFRAARLPLIRIRAQARYDLDALATTIEQQIATAHRP